MMQFAAQIGQRLRVRRVRPEHPGDALPGLGHPGVGSQKRDEGNRVRRMHVNARIAVDDGLLAQDRHVQHVDAPPDITALLGRIKPNSRRRCGGQVETLRDSCGGCRAGQAAVTPAASVTESNHDDALTDIVWTLLAPARAEQSSHLVRI